MLHHSETCHRKLGFQLAQSLTVAVKKKVEQKAALQATVTSLSSQPGMAWMGQLQNDPSVKDKINWTAVTQAHDSWDYKQQGLTKEGAAIVTLVVAYFTAGIEGSVPVVRPQLATATPFMAHWCGGVTLQTPPRI